MPVQIGSYPVLRELTPEYYQLIGRIITDFAFLEMTLQDCVYILLRLHRRQGRIAVRSPRTNELVTMIEELIELYPFKSSVNTAELKKALVTVTAARDAVGHGIWLKHDGTSTPVLQVVSGSFAVLPGETKAKARITPVAMETSPDDLRASISNIKWLTDAAEKLRAEIEEKIGPLPETPPSR